jgi:hypothetical protein
MTAPNKSLTRDNKTPATEVDRYEYTEMPSYIDTERVPTGLFNLPAELRNQIYKLVLTAEEHKQIFYVMPASIYADRKPMLMQLKPSEKGMIELGKAATTPSFNRIQSVNRQLRQETHDLELQTNTIHFAATCLESQIQESSIGCLLAFRDACSPAKFSMLSKVRVRSMGPYNEALSLEKPLRGLWPVINFCKAHPHIEVQYVLQAFVIDFTPGRLDRGDTSEFFRLGASMTLALRKDFSSYDEVLRLYINHSTSRSAQVNRSFRREVGWGSLVNIVHLDEVFSGVDNFGIFPNIEAMDDETFANCGWGWTNVMTYGEQQREDWRKWANLWIKDGIKPDLEKNSRY